MDAKDSFYLIYLTEKLRDEYQKDSEYYKKLDTYVNLLYTLLDLP